MEEFDKVLITKIRQLETIQPRNEWKMEFREKLVRSMAKDQAKSKQPIVLNLVAKEVGGVFSLHKIFDIKRLINAFQPSLVYATALMLLVSIGSGFAVVAAADRSLPGDTLYSLKLAEERLRFNFTSNGEQRVAMRLEFLNNRMSEIDASIQLDEDADKKADRMEVAVGAMKEEMTNINNDFDKVVTNSTAGVAAKVAKNIDERINTSSKTLAKATTKLPATVTKKITSNVNEAMKIAEETTNKTLAVLIENHEQSPVVTDDELAQKIEHKIESTEARLKTVQEKAQSMVTASAKASADQKNTTDKNGKIDGVNEKKNEIDQSAAAVLSKEAQEMINDARIKLQLKDISGALKTANDSESLLKATEKIVDSSMTGNTDTYTLNQQPDSSSSPYTTSGSDNPSPSVTPKASSVTPLNLWPTVSPSPSTSPVPTATPKTVSPLHFGNTLYNEVEVPTVTPNLLNSTTR